MTDPRINSELAAIAVELAGVERDLATLLPEQVDNELASKLANARRRIDDVRGALGTGQATCDQVSAARGLADLEAKLLVDCLRGISISFGSDQYDRAKQRMRRAGLIEFSSGGTARSKTWRLTSKGRTYAEVIVADGGPSR